MKHLINRRRYRCLMRMLSNCRLELLQLFEEFHLDDGRCVALLHYNYHSNGPIELQRRRSCFKHNNYTCSNYTELRGQFHFLMNTVFRVERLEWKGRVSRPVPKVPLKCLLHLVITDPSAHFRERHPGESKTQ